MGNDFSDRLSRIAHQPHSPFVPPETKLPEFTIRAVVSGIVLGLLFGASSLYLVLKVGLTVSASIPIAVISLGLFRVLTNAGVKPASILEHNIVQTTGSAGESLAFGIGVTMPAILILGFDLDVCRVTLVAALGGLLGIAMMIPLRRALIVQQHGVLKYPEGTACAEVLKAGTSLQNKPNTSMVAGAQLVFCGFAVGFVYKFLMSGLRLWKEIPEKVFGKGFAGGSISAEVSPELLGVGYIIGPRIASIMFAGGALSYLVLIPLIRFFGGYASTPISPATTLISDMSPHQIRDAYVLYIGAGAVAMGGIISILRSIPLITSSFKIGLRDTINFGDYTKGNDELPRTEREIPMGFVIGAIVILVVGITLAPPLEMNILGAILIVVFGFIFVTVSSRLTGEIGSSSNPISGMTVATLLLTCLLFVLLGWKGPMHYITALSVGAIVCIAAANAGTTSQDLKTGYLLGATPRLQQWAIAIGTAASAIVLGPVLILLNTAATVYVPAEKVAPSLKVPPEEITNAPLERLKGPQSVHDRNLYRVWSKRDGTDGPPGKYLVDEKGTPVWYVDPGINGQFTVRPDGSEVTKFYAPKAMLMSYIVKGVLGGELAWQLVIVGALIAVVLELCNVPSLAFAVGVYLPISASMPIFIGGMASALVDRVKRKKKKNPQEPDHNGGVLLASGYIAGGAMAGIIIAISVGTLGNLIGRITAWTTKGNPFSVGPYADALSLLPFLCLAALLIVFGVVFGRQKGP